MKNVKIQPHSYDTPNSDVLDAQSRVCTGPGQSRPLGLKPGDPDPVHILTIILESLQGHLTESEAASRPQIGSFLAAMTIRRHFPPRTAWSPAETAAFEAIGPALSTQDPVIAFLISPEAVDSTWSYADQTLASHLLRILHGEHLSYNATREVLLAIASESGDPALKAAVLIGQRMNHEDYAEFRGYLDAIVDPGSIVEVSTPSLTTIGEPYNGSSRFFKPTCFVVAVRAALGHPTLMHGVDSAPPKRGVTEEQILRALGANTRLSVEDAAALIEDERIAFAFLNQQDFAADAYRMLDLRSHIGKRPTWAATEKAQLILRSTGRNDLVTGYFHPGYEEKHLRSMRERGLSAGCVIKGEEGTSQFSLRSGAASEGDRKTLNYVEGFAPSGTFHHDIDPAELGFRYDQSPRPDTVSPESFAHAGYAALQGEAGHIYDRIILNAGLLDWLLGYATDPVMAIEQARKAIDEGSARRHLDAYIEASNVRRPGR
jgi:anthranilate phosphoribosyltransferase